MQIEVTRSQEVTLVERFTMNVPDCFDPDAFDYGVGDPNYLENLVAPYAPESTEIEDEDSTPTFEAAVL